MSRLAHHVIVGGGISGLSVAWFLRRLVGPAPQITVIEASHRVGGWVESVRHEQGFLFERGPRGFRPSGNGAAALELAESAGLADEAVASSSDSAMRYLWKDGQLQKLPNGPLEALQSPLTSGLAKEAWRERSVLPSLDADESIRSFMSRRFSDATADTLVDGMVSGIYAGDISKLSAASCSPFNMLRELEQEHGSVVTGMVRRRM
eukprot:g1594.t1